MSDKEILQRMFCNAFINLKNAVIECVKNVRSSDNLMNITECLTLTVHLMMDYMERYFKEDDIVRAFKYVNNSLKHKGGVIIHSELCGGFTFQIEFPMESEDFKIVWKHQTSVRKYKEQIKAYNELLAGKEIIETMEPIAERIRAGYEDE